GGGPWPSRPVLPLGRSPPPPCRPPLSPFLSSPCWFPPPLVFNHLYRSTPIARLIFARRSSSSRLPTAMTTGRGVVSSRRRIVLLRAVMSSALRMRIPTFGSSRTFATCASTASRPTLNVFRTPASLNPWTNSSRPTAASSILHHQEVPNHGGVHRALLYSLDDPLVLELPFIVVLVIEIQQVVPRKGMVYTAY